MALTNAVRGVKGFESVAKAVRSHNTFQEPEMDEAPVAPPMSGAMDAAAPTTAAEGTQASKGFMLPDDETDPDPNLPEYQGPEGQKKLSEAQSHIAHRRDIHQAYRDLEEIFSKMEPKRDFQKEYLDMVAAQGAHEKERPRENAVVRFGLALGENNPAQKGALEGYSGKVKEEGERSDKSFAQRMMLKAKMHETAAAEAEASGNWRKALKEQEALALLKADEDRLKHGREMEKVTTQVEGANTRAKYRRDSAEKVASIRASAIGSGHGLSGSFLAQFNKEAAKAVAKLLGPRDLTKEYTPADLDNITDYLEGIAEMLHDQQFGTEDSGAAFSNTHPRKRGAAKPKEKF